MVGRLKSTPQIILKMVLTKASCCGVANDCEVTAGLVHHRTTVNDMDCLCMLQRTQSKAEKENTLFEVFPDKQLC